MGAEHPPLLIRADANARMGTGHLMRCLALAQAWEAQGGSAIFVTACDSAGLRQRLRDEGFRAVYLEAAYPDPSDWKTTSRVLEAHPAAWLVLDGYHFDPAYQLRIKECGHPLLVIDDMAHLDHYCADVVLNQNVHAQQLNYACEPGTTLLLGTRFVLLRREFWPWRGWRREIPDVARRVLITMGGADPDNQTRKVIRALQQVGATGIEATVVVGAGNPYPQEIKDTCRRAAFAVHLIYNTSDIPKLMAWADVAVSSGGGTCWELAFMGLPTAYVVLARNQQKLAESLDRLGAGRNLGWHMKVSEQRIMQALQDLIASSIDRKSQSENGKHLVDGMGAERVARALAEDDSQSGFLIRLARWEDADLLWQWANDPLVRANSFHPDPIPLDQHLHWYKDKLLSPDTCFLVVEEKGKAVAQVRFDRGSESEAEISFSVAREYRGRHIGTQALTLAPEVACRALKVKRVKGLVFDSNEASKQAFVRAGFSGSGQESVAGRLCHIFVKACSDSVGERL